MIAMNELQQKLNSPCTVQNKTQVTLRLDRDILEFFKKDGKRYQTRINAVLREFARTQMNTENI